MIGHVAIALALGQEVEIGLDEGGSAAKEKGDLSDLHFLVGELGTAREGGQIVGDRLGRVVHDLADLRGGLALESEADDLSAMGENRPEVMERAAHRDQDVGVCLAHDLQVAGDGSRGDEEDAVGEVFGGEQRPLTEGLLAEVEQSRLAKGGRSVLMNQQVVDLATMQGEADGLLVAVGDGFSGWLVSSNGDERDLARRS